MSDTIPGSVLVMGAGAIGCYLGGSLAAAEVSVIFVGRPRTLSVLSDHGLTVSDLDGGRSHVPGASLQLADSIPRGCKPALVLLTVKSGATAEAGREFAAVLPADTLVVSMQNGLSNVSVAREVAPTLRVLPGMVPYNVAQIGPGHFHRGTGGVLGAQDNAQLRPWLPTFARAGIPLTLHADLKPIQWGKLLLNLNNPVNALSGRPLRDELLQRGYRRCLAALIDEALGILDTAGIKPARAAAVPPYVLPGLLRLPTPIFRLIAARMLRIDAQARSSMADDLALGRPTEIDVLCGEVARLARSLNRRAPRNEKMVELLEAWPRNPKPMTPAEMLTAMGLR